MMAAKTKKVAIGVVGPGLVGGELLRQMEATRPLLAKQGIDVIPHLSIMPCASPLLTCHDDNSNQQRSTECTEL